MNLLKRDGLEVLWSAGAGEKGADLIATSELWYSLSSRLAVQVKNYSATHHDQSGLDQLERAFREHNVDAALLVSFADELGTDLSTRVGELKKRHKIDVLYGDDLYLRLLELVADPNFETT